MKKRLVLLGIILSSVFNYIQATDIEARTGIMGGDVFGLQTGVYINFPQSKLFSVQTGLLFQTASQLFRNADTWDIDLNIPVYASFHIPLNEKVNLRLNGGAYFGLERELHLGATADIGVEVKRLFVGINCFQNCINSQGFLFGASVGYKFHL